jgi:serine/threonine protein phosphatase PrpC
MSVQWFSSQLIGGRTEQQDASIVLIGSNSQSALAVVADGAGGHQGGREASQKVVEIARAVFHAAGGKLEKPEAALEELCSKSHDAINALGPDPKHAPRSTVVAVYLCSGKAHWVHVGDSRLYRLHNGRIIERTRDHTMAQILLEQGEIKDSEVGRHPDRVKLLKALGGEDAMKPSLGSAPLAAGDRFLLCSDGFWERLKLSEIEKCMRGRPSQKTLDRIVEKAAGRNGERGDNVTACLIGFGDDHDTSRSRGSGLAMVGLTALASAVVADRTLKVLGRIAKQ